MGKYLNMIRQAEKFQGQTSQDKEPVQGQSCPVEARPLLLGDEVTWQGSDGKAHEGVIEFVHTDHDGSRWAFCSVADRWVAVNTKFVTMVEEGGQN